MKHRRIAALLLLSAFVLAGCKIQISVPEGGAVTTASGDINCASGQTCTVDVSDLFFDETFQAVPAEGYFFTGWKRRDRGLCGGAAGVCQLFTAGFAGDPNLMRFLEDPSEIFYLEPVFEEGNFGPGGAAACFNRELVSPGTQVEADYRTTDSASNTVLEFSYTQQISGGHSFNGNNALRARSNITTSGPTASVSQNDTFFSVNPTLPRVTEYGNDTQVTSPQNVRTEVTFAPPVLTRLDLAQGQSYTVNWTQTEKTSIQGVPFLNETRDVSRTHTYLGRQTITVPAGTFATCVIRSEETSQAGSYSGYSWFGVGSGMLIQEDDQGITSVLTSASVNGQAL